MDPNGTALTGHPRQLHFQVCDVSGYSGWVRTEGHYSGWRTPFAGSTNPRHNRVRTALVATLLSDVPENVYTLDIFFFHFRSILQKRKIAIDFVANDLCLQIDTVYSVRIFAAPAIARRRLTTTMVVVIESDNNREIDATIKKNNFFPKVDRVVMPL